MKPESLVSGGHQDNENYECTGQIKFLALNTFLSHDRLNFSKDSIEKDINITMIEIGNCFGRKTIFGLTLSNEKLYAQLDDVFIFMKSFAEYVPAPCTHRPSSQSSEGSSRTARFELTFCKRG